MRVYVDGNLWTPPEGYGPEYAGRGFRVVSPDVLGTNIQVKFTYNPEIVTDAVTMDLSGSRWYTDYFDLSYPNSLANRRYQFLIFDPSGLKNLFSTDFAWSIAGDNVRTGFMYWTEFAGHICELREVPEGHFTLRYLGLEALISLMPLAQLMPLALNTINKMVRDLHRDVTRALRTKVVETPKSRFEHIEDL